MRTCAKIKIFEQIKLPPFILIFLDIACANACAARVYKCLRQRAAVHGKCEMCVRRLMVRSVFLLYVRCCFFSVRLCIYITHGIRRNCFITGLPSYNVYEYMRVSSLSVCAENKENILEFCVYIRKVYTHII